MLKKKNAAPRPERRFTDALRRSWPGAVSGLALTLSYAPLGWWWTAWIALIPLYALLSRGPGDAIATATPKPPRSSFLWGFAPGFWFGTVLFLAGMPWMSRIGFIPYVILCLLQGVPFAVLAIIAARVLPRLSPRLRPLVWAAMWVLLEASKSYGKVAFPWFLLAASQAHAVPLVQIVSVTGQWGLSFAVAAVNGLWVEAWRLRSDLDTPRRTVRRYTAIPICALLGLFVFGYWELLQIADWAMRVHLKSDTTRRVIATAQGSHRKQRAERYTMEDQQAALQTYLDLSRDIMVRSQKYIRQPDMIVWPETVAPGYLLRDRALYETVSGLARDLRTPLLVGTTDVDENGLYRNTGVLFDRNGMDQGRYDKQQLVPMGEFFLFRPVLGPIYARFPVPADDFVEGNEPGLFTVGGMDPQKAMRVGVVICYESAFPRLPAQRVRDGAQVIVQLTSDQTFDGTWEPEQHADLAVLRAVETRRNFVRAASSGVTSVIGCTGSVEESLPVLTRDALIATVLLRDDITPYVRFGDWFVAVCAGIAGWGLYRAARRAKPTPSNA